MAGWQSQVLRCFGAVDVVFAGYPNEENWAWASRAWAAIDVAHIKYFQPLVLLHRH